MSLVLLSRAYPCSVDAGVAPLEFAMFLYDRGMRNPAEKDCRMKELCGILNCKKEDLTSKDVVKEYALFLKDPVKFAGKFWAQLNSKSPAQKDRHMKKLARLLHCEPKDLTNAESVMEHAVSLSRKWGYKVRIDKSKMGSDMGIVLRYPWTPDIRRPRFDTDYDHETGEAILSEDNNVVCEAGDEHISEIRGFLTTFAHAKDNEVQVLYLIGHGLKEEAAKRLNEEAAKQEAAKQLNTSTVEDCKCSSWRWPLYNCYVEDPGIGKPAIKVLKDAKKGDLIVFYSGFLSPEWVVERLNDESSRDRCRTSKKRNIVIVVDSCYSGTWKTVMSSQLKLEHTRVLLQTACGPDETSRGGVFTPLFHDLQNADTEAVKKCDSYKKLPQSPTFYDSESVGDDIDIPFAEKDVNGVRFRFFNQPEFFHKFASIRNVTCHKKSRSAVFEEFLPNIPLSYTRLSPPLDIVSRASPTSKEVRLVRETTLDIKYLLFVFFLFMYFVMYFFGIFLHSLVFFVVVDVVFLFGIANIVHLYSHIFTVH